MTPENQLGYKSIFDMITLPIIVLDSNKKLVFANEKSIELLGLDKTKLSEVEFTQLFELDENELKKMETSLKTKAPYRGKTLHKIQGQDNEYMELKLLVRPIKIPLQTKLGYYIEIDESQQLELSEENMRRLGQKASQIAHDISNPLAVLRIHCDNFQLLAKKNQSFSSQQVLERLKKFSSATDRLSLSNDELKKLSKTLVNLDIDAVLDLIDQSPTPDYFSH